MTKPTVHEYNCETNEETVREMTDEEHSNFLALIEEEKNQQIARETEEAAKAEAKAAALAKLTALGLTEEEAKAIAG